MRCGNVCIRPSIKANILVVLDCFCNVVHARERFCICLLMAGSWSVRDMMHVLGKEDILICACDTEKPAKIFVGKNFHYIVHHLISFLMTAFLRALAVLRASTLLVDMPTSTANKYGLFFLLFGLTE